MGKEAIKLELLDWLRKLEDEETIAYLKLVKDSKVSDKDWWGDLTKEQLRGIKKGLKDVDQGRVISHEQVKKEFGL